MATGQLDLSVAGQMQKRELTPMALMMVGLESGKLTAADLQILQEMHFKQQAKDAEFDFNQAMNQVQMEVGRVAPNLTNPQTRSRYASYDKLDAELRPIYTRHGFSLSFSTDPSISPELEMVRVVCHVSRGGYTRNYYYDMPADGKGAKGGDVMTKTHARSAAGSYGMRYLLKMIFNIAIGEDDTDGNAPEAKPAPQMDQEEFRERLAFIPKCSTLDELKDHWKASYEVAKKANDRRAMDAFNDATEARKRALLAVK